MIEIFSVTQLLAIFFGLYFIAGGIGLLIERDSYENFIGELLTNIPMSYTIAILVFVLGAFTVSLHNNWSGILEVFISFVGWAMLVEGFLMLAFRRPFLQIVNNISFTAATAVPFGIGTLILGVLVLISGLSQ